MCSGTHTTAPIKGVWDGVYYELPVFPKNFQKTVPRPDPWALHSTGSLPDNARVHGDWVPETLREAVMMKAQSIFRVLVCDLFEGTLSAMPGTALQIGL